MTKPAYTYDELDEIFRGNGHNDIVGMSFIDGLIAALVAGPVFVDPREWLPLIFEGRLPAVRLARPSIWPSTRSSIATMRYRQY